LTVDLWCTSYHTHASLSGLVLHGLVAWCFLVRANS
jgi:hypothetical protein